MQSTHNSKEKSAKIPSKYGYWSLYRYCSVGQWILFAVSSLIGIVSGASLPLLSLLLGDATNAFEPGTPKEKIIDIIEEKAVQLLLVGLGTVILYFVGHVLHKRFGEVQTVLVRRAYIQALLRQEMAWYDSNNPAEVSAQVESDMKIVNEGLYEKFGLLIYVIGAMVAAFLVAFIKGWQISLVILGITPFMAISSSLFFSLITKANKKKSSVYAKAGALALEVLTTIKTVVGLNGERQELNKYKTQLEQTAKVNVKYGLFQGLSFGFNYLVSYGGFAVAFLVGSKFIEDGLFNHSTDLPYKAGDILTAFFAILIGVMGLSILGPAIKGVGASVEKAKKIFAIIDRDSQIDIAKTLKNGKIIENLKSEIEFNDVDFHYPTRPDRRILNNLSLKIKSGQKVALVGESGCGKSTCVQLLQRLYEPQGGSITIDGVKLKEFNLKWLRSQISYVGQEPILFSTTIRQNLAYAVDEVSEEMMIDALKKANIYSFVMSLEDGLDTYVGTGGTQLSGGQKQRIAIARAIIRNTKILLLDEATSALDRKNEKEIQVTLDKISVNRTTIIIAHRLSTVREADNIIVLRNGKVEEQGTHEELIKLKGKYFHLAEAQLTAEENATQDTQNMNSGTSNLELNIEGFSDKPIIASDNRNNYEQNLQPRLDQSNFYVEDDVPFEKTQAFFKNLVNLLSKDTPTKTNLDEVGKEAQQFSQQQLQQQGNQNQQRDSPRKITNTQQVAGSLELQEKELWQQYNTSPKPKQTQGSLQFVADDFDKVNTRLNTEAELLTERQKINPQNKKNVSDETREITVDNFAINKKQENPVTKIQSDDVNKSGKTKFQLIEECREKKLIEKIKQQKAEIEKEKKKLSKMSFKRLQEYAKPERKQFYLSLFASIGIGVVNPIFAIFFSEMLFILLDSADPEFRSKANETSLSFVYIAIGAFIFNAIELWLYAILSENLSLRLRCDLFYKFMRMHMSWHDNPANNPGVLSTVLESEIGNVSSLTSTTIGIAFQVCSAVLSAIIISLANSWKLTLISVGVTPIIGVAAYINVVSIGGFGSVKAEKDSETLSNEVINNMKTVVTLGLEERFANTFENLAIQIKQARIRTSYGAGTGMALSNGLVFAYMALLFWAGAQFHVNDGLQLKSMFVAMYALMFAAFSIANALQLSPDFGKGLASSKAIFSYLDIESKIDIEDKQLTHKTDIKGDIEFKNVKFKYAGRDKIVFKDLNMQIKAGQNVALVGESGCGKSTIVQLLMRFYDVDEGEIMIDGVNIKKYNLDNLRQQLGLVAQEPILFSGTIEQNIKYRDIKASNEQMKDAAIQANALSFIEKNDFDKKDIVIQHGEGFQRIVGPKGSQLSGGQKQRIAIARAILSKPKVLLLDEATSALDTKSEEIVQDSLNKISGGRTSIAIAHRFSTIKQSDKIYVFQEGEIVEEGTYDQLSPNKGTIFFQLERGLN